jgi:hypothetical protein
MLGHYSRQGIIDTSLYHWTFLEPFLKVMPEEATFDPENLSTGLPVQLIKQDWGNRFILEICSWILEEPRLGGDHLWLRLKTPGACIFF